MQVINDGFSLTANDRICSWLPIYHDMGLSALFLNPLRGMRIYLLSPMDVLQQPLCWLQAISDYQLTGSGGPNFIYQHCINRIKPEEKQQLDLSSWTLAYNGAEPVSRHTLNAFADAFASCGFNANALTPCYGMAETTLMVSSNPRVNHFDAIVSETDSDIRPGVSSGISSGKVRNWKAKSSTPTHGNCAPTPKPGKSGCVVPASPAVTGNSTTLLKKCFTPKFNPVSLHNQTTQNTCAQAI